MRYADTMCQYREVFKPEHAYVYTGRCVISGEEYSVTVPADGLFKYRRGAKIEDAFPNMPVEDREFLMSGISPTQFDGLFA